MKDSVKNSTAPLPHQAGMPFLIDGGIETTLIFHDKLDLPYFSAFTLLETAEGRAVLRRYYQRHLDIALNGNLGFVLESATWRANADWGALLGYDAEALRDINIRAIELLREIRDAAGPVDTPIVLSGCIGPRGDGYVVDAQMTAEEAEIYHRAQIEALKQGGAQFATAMTMTYAAEAIGIVRAAQAAGLPIVIAFTTETDGRLPSGQTISRFIEEVDAATASGPVYYMINCAHPDHFRSSLCADGDWRRRIRGVRANASRLSHAELDEAEELDSGDPEELGRDYTLLRELLPGLTVFGGCCGTDHRHIEQACRAVQAGHNL